MKSDELQTVLHEYSYLKSNFTSLHNPNRRRRTILLLKKGKRCNNVFSYNTVTKKYKRKSSSPKKPRVGVPGLQSKIAWFLK